MLAVSAVGITQQLVWAASALAIYTGRTAIFAKLGMPNANSITLPHVSIGMGIAFGLFFLLGFVFYSSLFAAAGATVSSDQEAQQAAQPITMLLVASIIFLQPIVLAPSSTMAKVLSWLPFSAPIVMPLRMSVVPLPTLEIVLVIARPRGRVRCVDLGVGADLSRGAADVREAAELQGTGEVDRAVVTQQT